MSAIPEADPSQIMKPVLLEGERPSPANPPVGCRFHTRCQYVTQICRESPPALKEGEAGHLVACHRAGELTLNGALEHGASISTETRAS